MNSLLSRWESILVCELLQVLIHPYLGEDPLIFFKACTINRQQYLVGVVRPPLHHFLLRFTRCTHVGGFRELRRGKLSLWKVRTKLWQQRWLYMVQAVYSSRKVHHGFGP